MGGESVEEAYRTRRWLWFVVPAVLLIIAAVFGVRTLLPSQQTSRVPDHFVNISGTITEAVPVPDLLEATMTMEDPDLVRRVMDEPETWQGYELTLRLTDKSTGFHDGLTKNDWFVNPGVRWAGGRDNYHYEELPEQPALIVGPWHGDEPASLTKGTEDYRVRLVVNKEGKTEEQLQQYIDNITIDVQTTVQWQDKEVDYVMTPVTWAK